MFCSNCGTSFPDSASFCPNCGKKVGVRRASSAQGAPAGQVSAAAPQQAAQPQGSGQSQPKVSQQAPQPQPQAPQQAQQSAQPSAPQRQTGHVQDSGQHQAHQAQPVQQESHQAAAAQQAQAQSLPIPVPEPERSNKGESHQGQAASAGGTAATASYPATSVASPQVDPKTFVDPRPAKKNIVPLVAAAALLVLVLVAGISLLRGCRARSGAEPEVAPSVSQVALSADVEQAIDDAATIGENLASEGDEYSEALESLDSVLASLAHDREVVQGAMNEADENTKSALGRADRAIANIEADARFLADLMGLLTEFSQTTDSLLAENDDTEQVADDLSTLYASVADTQEKLLALDVPEHLRQPVEMLANDGLGQLKTTLAYSYQTLYGAATGTGIYTLALYETDELLTWTGVKATQAGNLLAQVFNADTSESAAVLRGTAGTTTEFTCEFVDEISPNLYPSMDSVVNIYGKTRSEKQDVMIEVEVAGFTQKWEERVTMEQGVSFYMIKPTLLPNNQLSDLTKEQTTQINLTITDVETGDVLVKKNNQIKLKSIYSMAWLSDEFGSTAQFDILAWMRPNIDEVDAINRKANDYMQEWAQSSMAGYQFGDDVIPTLLQVAAIQSAISDSGVQYQNDSYSLTSSDQNVLTPDAVIKKQQGLCIETTLLMASCLKRLGMHPVIVLTPGHAQCAVETYAGSGNYFLIETTKLPYKVNTNYEYDDVGFYNGLLASTTFPEGTYTWTTTGSAQEWADYLDYVYQEGLDEYGGIFIIDCNLMDELDIKGLDV